MKHNMYIFLYVRPRKMNYALGSNDGKFPFLASFIACGIPAAIHRQ